MSVRLDLLLGVCCLSVACTGPAEASRRSGEIAEVGAFIFGISYGLPATVATATLIGSRQMGHSDLQLTSALLVPCAGPAIAGVMLVESHPLTKLVCGYLFILSAVQTIGMVLLVQGLVELAGGRGRRCAGVWPSAGPMGVGLVGVF